MSTTLTSKGQVTVPKKMRDYLGLVPGASVDFRLGANGDVIVTAARDMTPKRGKGRFDALRGSLERGRSTDALIELLRDYDSDRHDPGFAE